MIRLAGNAIAADIRVELKAKVEELKNQLGVVPGLAVVLVGDRRDSATYVRSKKKACAEIGITSFGIDFPASVTQDELIAKVDELNADPAVHGILVQLPLPSHIDERSVLDRISQEKDVDGLHPLNVAQLANTKTHSSGRAGWSFDNLDFHVSCTPQGCIELLDRCGVSIEGKDAVVLGRSNIVGIPVALLLMQRNATVTIAHSRTKDIEATVRRADIVVAAVGRAEMVQGSWIKPGAAVIDVGINSKDDPTDKRGVSRSHNLTAPFPLYPFLHTFPCNFFTVRIGYRLVGDVDYESCRQNASYITPVCILFAVRYCLD